MEFMTISQAAKKIGISRAALYKAIDRERVFTVEIMGITALTGSEVKRFKALRAKAKASKNGKK